VTPTRVSNARRTRLAATAIALAVAAAGPAARAQPPGVQGAIAPEIQLAANDRNLWLAEIGAQNARLLHRTPSTRFVAGSWLRSRVAAMHAIDDDLYVVFPDHSVFRFFSGGSSPIHTLSRDQRPLQLVGDDAVLYALIDSATAARLPPPAATSEPSAEEAAPPAPPFDPGDSSLSLVRYDGRGWSPLAACPAEATWRGGDAQPPQLCLAGRQLVLVWCAAGRLDVAVWNVQTGAWQPTETVSTDGVRQYWCVAHGDVPIVLHTSREGAGTPPIALRRLGGSGDGLVGAWRRATLTLSVMPDDAGIERYISAFSFNQHIGLFGIDGRGDALVRFGRIGDGPSEPGFRPADAFRETDTIQRTSGVFQFATFIVLLAVLTGLFVFRRDAMVSPAALPAGVEPAYAFQRLLSFLIDFSPFLIAAGIALPGVRPLDALQRVAMWGLGREDDSGLPSREILLWWGLSCGGYAVYSLVMEAVTGRTVGKVVAGVRILGESGARPTLLQILVRNAMRIIELTPQFWVLGLLVVFSRNRQRLGDLFARTVVVRRSAPDVRERAADGDADRGNAQRARSDHDDEQSA
jgi:uncharacterized RDD family membrane protein YckC